MCPRFLPHTNHTFLVVPLSTAPVMKHRAHTLRWGAARRFKDLPVRLLYTIFLFCAMGPMLAGAVFTFLLSIPPVPASRHVSSRAKRRNHTHAHASLTGLDSYLDSVRVSLARIDKVVQKRQKRGSRKGRTLMRYRI
jgi:hypothetical protein